MIQNLNFQRIHYCFQSSDRKPWSSSSIKQARLTSTHAKVVLVSKSSSEFYSFFLPLLAFVFILFSFVFQYNARRTSRRSGDQPEVREIPKREQLDGEQAFPLDAANFEKENFLLKLFNSFPAGILLDRHTTVLYLISNVICSLLSFAEKLFLELNSKKLHRIWWQFLRRSSWKTTKAEGR